jgi:hypothetical protein
MPEARGSGRQNSSTASAKPTRVTKPSKKAVLNENNDLGLVLNRSVDIDSIPALMRSMLTQMNKEFPGQDLTIIAYTPTQPPVRIGTAHLDAQTRDMTYTPQRK